MPARVDFAKRLKSAESTVHEIAVAMHDVEHEDPACSRTDSVDAGSPGTPPARTS